jgi:hypothetical protein
LKEKDHYGQYWGQGANLNDVSFKQTIEAQNKKQKKHKAAMLRAN